MESKKSSADNTPPHRRRLGRAGRKRRRKLLEIQSLADAIRRGESVQLVASREEMGHLPVDRGDVWPAALERRREYLNTSSWIRSADEVALVHQLGFFPGNAIRIASRARDVCYIGKYLNTSSSSSGEEPVVLQLYPLAVRRESGQERVKHKKTRKRKAFKEDENAQHERGEDETNNLESGSLVEPFPTIYWLTHPTLRILVSKLELESFASELERRLQSDTEALESMKRAHHLYSERRITALTEKDNFMMKKRKWDTAIGEGKGIAGMGNFAGIKCLHAHVAHFLSGDAGFNFNIVGKWVMEALDDMLSGETERTSP